MVTVETTLTELQTLVGSAFNVAELSEILFQIGFEVDDYDESEDLLKIDITPDRLDTISAIGLARMLKHFLQTAQPAQYIAHANTDYSVLVDKSVLNVRPFTACVVVKGLAITDSQLIDIIRVQEKLHATFGKHRKKAAIGVYPLSKIQWPISYVAHEPKTISFQPLGSDTAMSASQILTEHETGIAYAHLLENEKLYPLFIDAASNVLSMPPIINSAEVGKVSVGDSDLFIECSGSDLHALHAVIQNLSCMLSDMGGVIYEVAVEYSDAHRDLITTSYALPLFESQKKPETKLVCKSPQLHSQKRTISTQQVAQKIGVTLDAAEISLALQKMGYVATEVFSDTVELAVAPYRNDIWHDVDVIDDVVRGYGLANIEPKLPQLHSTGALLGSNQFSESLKKLCVGLGLIEVKTLGVTDMAHQFDKMGISKETASFMKLQSTAERSINMLRVSLIPELCHFCANNQSVTLPHQIFEIGDCIIPDKTADVLSKNVSRFAFLEHAQKVSFTDAKQLSEYVLTRLGFECTYVPVDKPYYIKGRSASIKVGATIVGEIGELAIPVLRNWGFSNPVIVGELYLDKLYELYQK